LFLARLAPANGCGFLVIPVKGGRKAALYVVSYYNLMNKAAVATLHIPIICVLLNNWLTVPNLLVKTHLAPFLKLPLAHDMASKGRLSSYILQSNFYHIDHIDPFIRSLYIYQHPLFRHYNFLRHISGI
jgi:hypothetical protein